MEKKYYFNDGIASHRFFVNLSYFGEISKK